MVEGADFPSAETRRGFPAAAVFLLAPDGESAICGVMRRFLPVVFALCLPAVSHAEELTDAQKKEHLERLKKLQEAAEGRADSRFRSAIAAFNAGMASDTAAMDLYIKCVEKVEFEEQKRKSTDFREWKRQKGDEMSKPSFRLALRHQLRWLVATLKAASGTQGRQAAAVEAQQAVDAIVNDARALKDQQGILSQSVMNSVFARAYLLQDVRVAKWPLAPVKAINVRQERPWRTGQDEEELQRRAEREARQETQSADFSFNPTGQLGEVYEQVLLPRYRMESTLGDLKALWVKRLQQEDIIYKNWSEDPNQGGRVGTVDAMRSPIYEKFLAEGLPGLQWQMEVDLYRHGDQKAAAGRMMTLLEKSMSLPAAEKWAEQLQALLSEGMVTGGGNFDDLKPAPGKGAGGAEESGL